MNDNDIRWIPAAGLGLNAFQVSLLEKLEKFGWCADFSGFGEDKADKALLCVLDVMSRKEKPNVFIICPERFAQNWYGAALLKLGTEFKLASGAKNAVYFFSPKLSNLFIASEEVLADEESAVLAEMRASSMVWDLIIIDASGNTDGMNKELYKEHIGMKAEQVMLFAPYPCAYNASSAQAAEITDIVKAVLDREITNIPALTPDVLRFSMDTPFLDYPSGREMSAKIRMIDYEIDRKRVPQSLHIEEMQGGGRYVCGGNIFEEYNLEERATYLRPAYTHTEAEILKNTDAKLKAFLDFIDPVINSDDKTAIVYFGTDATLNYVQKVLTAVYFEKESSIAVFGRNSFAVRRLKQWYEDEPAQKLRVILAKDDLGEIIPLFEPVTHIVNYELPDNPAVLQQRCLRRGMAEGGEPEFVIFCDSAGLFDGRVLKKALAGNLYKAFRPAVPCGNILFRLEGFAEILTDMLIDIKYIADYTGAVGSSFDIISRFKSDYNIPPERSLTTAARTHEYSKNKLSVLAAALGVSEFISQKEIDRDALLNAVSKKVAEISGGCAYFDENGGLSALPVSEVKNSDFKKFSGFLSGNPYFTGVERAKKKLKKMAEDAGGFAYLKTETAALSDIMCPPVLYHVWLYWHKELGLGGSYAEFIKAYNEGVI